MSKAEHHKTKPEDRVPFSRKVGYGCGMTAQAMMLQPLTQMASLVFNVCLGVNPVFIGWVMGGSRLWDAITDPVMGSVTDKTRSRWGRRRPWIALGGLFCALTFPAVWLMPRGMSESFYVSWFVVSVLLFYLAFTMFSVPYIALGMELSPDYHERTSVVAFRSIIAQAGGLVVASLYWFNSLPMFDDFADGMKVSGIVIGVAVLVLTLVAAITSREHPSLLKRQVNKPSVSLMTSVRETISHKPFLMIIAITVLLLIGTLMVNHLGAYISIYYVFGGDKGPAFGKMMTCVLWISKIGTLSSIPLLTMLSKRVGKRNALLAAISLALVGTLLKWFCYTPAHPYLQLVPALLVSSAFAGIWALVNAMIPDVVDLDELQTGERREGMFSAVYGWTYKLGVALALVVSGYVLNLSGFDVDLPQQTERSIFLMRLCFTVVPSAAIVLAFVVTWIYPVSEQRSYEIRQKLEQQREAQN